jgi:hypothetical protein
MSVLLGSVPDVQRLNQFADRGCGSAARQSLAAPQQMPGVHVGRTYQQQQPQLTLRAREAGQRRREGPFHPTVMPGPPEREDRGQRRHPRLQCEKPDDRLPGMLIVAHQQFHRRRDVARGRLEPLAPELLLGVRILQHGREQPLLGGEVVDHGLQNDPGTSPRHPAKSSRRTSGPHTSAASPPMIRSRVA